MAITRNSRRRSDSSTLRNSRRRSDSSTLSFSYIHLPMDLIFSILSRIPVKPLLRFKSVCKTWYTVIENPDFVKMHHTEWSKLTNNPNLLLTTSLLVTAFDCETGIYNISLQSRDKTPHLIYSIEHHSPPRILGICNGLFCATFADSETIICNPTTGKPVRKISPFSLPTVEEESDKVFYGFGCLQTQEATNFDYKLFRIIYSSSCLNFRGEVYSMTTNVDVWTEIEVKRGHNIDNDCVDPSSIFYFNCPHVTINKVFYRMGYISDNPCVLSFETSGNVFDMIAWPTQSMPWDWFFGRSSWKLVDFKGELGLAACACNDSLFKLWVLNNEEEEKRSYWTIKFSTEKFFPPLGRSLLAVLGYDRFDSFVMQLKSHDLEVKLFSYDPESQKVVNIPFTGLKKHQDVYLYTESLVSV